MKKKLLIIFSIIFLYIVGYFILNEYKKKQLVNEAQEKAEEYVIENYEDIESVQITPDNYHFDPMGGLSVGGQENNKDHLTFNISFFIDNNEVGEVISIVEAPDFPPDKDEEKESRFNLCLGCNTTFLINKFLLQKFQNSELGVPFYEKETVNYFFNHRPNHRRLFHI